MVLETILRNGISAGTWVAYKMSDDPADDRPSVLYSDKDPVPLDVTLITSDLSVMSFAGAKTRGWLTADRPTNEEIKKKIKEMLQTSGAVSVTEVVQLVQYQLPKAEEQQIHENVNDLIMNGPYAV